MSGGDLAQSLLAADAIDETGVPLFRDPGKRVALEMKAARVIDGGCVYAVYRVLP